MAEWRYENVNIMVTRIADGKVVHGETTMLDTNTLNSMLADWGPFEYAFVITPNKPGTYIKYPRDHKDTN